MNNILFMTLHLLLALTISAVPAHILTAPCHENQTSRVTSLQRLAYGSPVDVEFTSGQTIRLGSTSDGNSLTGKVAIEAMPESVITYWQGDTESAPDVSATMADGNNTITLIGDEGKVFWLITESPCPQAPQPETASVKAEPTPDVIAPQLDNESAPTIKPAPVATPVPIPTDDGAGMRRIVLVTLTLIIGLLKLLQIAWLIGAVILLLAGLVFALRHRERIQAWINRQIDTIRKAVWHS